MPMNRYKRSYALQNLNLAFSYNLKLLKLNGDAVLVDFGALKVDDKGRGGGNGLLICKNSNWKSAYRKCLIKKGIEENETHEEEKTENKGVEISADSGIDYEKSGEDKEIKAGEEVLKEEVSEKIKKHEVETGPGEVDYIKYLK